MLAYPFVCIVTRDDLQPAPLDIFGAPTIETEEFSRVAVPEPSI